MNILKSRYYALKILLFYIVCQWLTAGRCFSVDTPVSSTNKAVRHVITEIMLKVALNTITLTPNHHFLYKIGTLGYADLHHISLPVHSIWWYAILLYSHTVSNNFGKRACVRNLSRVVLDPHYFSTKIARRLKYP